MDTVSWLYRRYYVWGQTLNTSGIVFLRGLCSVLAPRFYPPAQKRAWVHLCLWFTWWCQELRGSQDQAKSHLCRKYVLYMLDTWVQTPPCANSSVSWHGCVNSLGIQHHSVCYRQRRCLPSSRMGDNHRGLNQSIDTLRTQCWMGWGPDPLPDLHSYFWKVTSNKINVWISSPGSSSMLKTSLATLIVWR